MNAQLRCLTRSAILLLEQINAGFTTSRQYVIDAESLAAEMKTHRGPVLRNLKKLETTGLLKRNDPKSTRSRWKTARLTPAAQGFLKTNKQTRLVLVRNTEPKKRGRPRGSGTTLVKERRLERGRARTDFVVEGKTYSLTKRQERVLFGIRDYTQKNRGFFPNPTDLYRFLGLNESNHTRAHMINDFRDIESLGLIARTVIKVGVSWSNVGSVTEAGQAFFQAYPSYQAVTIIRSRRMGGGVNPETGGTRFPDTLISVADLTLAQLVPKAESSGKLGARVRIGPRHKRQYKKLIATFSLEEGKTCSPACGLLDVCFAGKMSKQRRILYEGHKTDAQMAQAICAAGPRHYRINTIGDIPTSSFLEAILSALTVTGSTAFGYTHWQPESELGRDIRQLSDWYWDFFSVRTSYEDGSRAPLTERAAITMPEFDSVVLKRHHNAIPCPEQTGRVRSCGDCGLCWNTRRNIAFQLH